VSAFGIARSDGRLLGINAACILTADKYTKLNSFSSYNPSLLIRDAKKPSREAARSEGYENTPSRIHSVFAHTNAKMQAH
jgi:hypothetical protein